MKRKVKSNELNDHEKPNSSDPLVSTNKNIIKSTTKFKTRILFFLFGFFANGFIFLAFNISINNTDFSRTNFNIKQNEESKIRVVN